MAAGSGSRFGGGKQFAALGGRRVVDWSVEAAVAACDAVVLVLPPGVAWDGSPVEAVVPGGSTRSESVRAGLAVVPHDAEIVVVHDAARPLAGEPLFRAVVDAVRRGADAAVPARPVTDTLKRNAGVRVVETLDRVGLVAVQTPQAFRAGALRAAHRGKADATDDAALVEVAGGTVEVVAGCGDNLKITTAPDLARVERLLAERHR